MRFLDEAPESKSLSIKDTKLIFEINEETEEAEFDTRLQICISEKNCKETKPIRLRISSMCKLNKMPTQAIGKIESQFVEYLGQKTITVPKLPGFENNCGPYAY